MPIAHLDRPQRSRLRSRLTTSLLAALLIAAGALLAPAASAAAATPLGPTVVQTNEAPSGYSVSFRYEAPAGVDSVQIYGDWFFSRTETVTCTDCSDRFHPAQWQPGYIATTPWLVLPMEQGDDGIWEITVPLPAGSFRYAFTHDCTDLLATGCTLHPDPANPWPLPVPYPNAPGAVRSTIYVPVHEDFPTYDNAYQAPTDPALAGTIEARRYPSPLSTNPVGVHDLAVYLPHGYDPDRATPYPTLYLSHGGGDHSTAWTNQGVAHYILENAIQEGAVQPMVIVSTDFNGLPGGNNGYVAELRNNVIPFVEASYNVSTRSEDRAFGGFSAGGSRAFTIMYDHTDLFGYHAAWSIGGPVANQAQIDRMKAVTGGIHIGTGLQDRLGNIAVTQLARIAELKAAGVEIDDYHVNGSHTWHVWRPLLNYYLRNLAFRTTSTELEVQTAPAGASHIVRVTATATVDTVTTSVVAPSGKVEFYAGEHYLGSAPVRNGVATLRKAVDGSLLDGPVVAHYQGDDLFNPSHSTPVDAG
jgi:enterochelin esterase-like enzyme